MIIAGGETDIETTPEFEAEREHIVADSRSARSMT